LTWYLLAADRGADIAGVLSLTATLLLAAGSWLVRSYDLSDEALAAAARRLAVLVRREWAGALQGLLAGSGASEPADVGYVRSERAGLAGGGLVRWRSDGGADAGSLADIAAYFSALDRGRLVVLGTPGSGKTVLAVYLLLERLEAVLAVGTEPGRVPVLLSLPAWPATHPDATDRELSAHFDRWVARHLVETYRLAEPVAAALVEGRWVLPVLDGLDEMDRDDDAGAGGMPRRASLVVRALNQDPGTGLRPMVLTCREHRYLQLAAGGGEVGVSPVLEDATAVTVQPLTPAQVTAYLAYRFPGPSPEPLRPGLEPRWQPVAAALTADPAGVLAAKLGTPWRLFLAVTGYYAGDTRPAELVDIAQTYPSALDEHLLGRLIPAAALLHRRPGGARYQPGEVIRGLATLASHLARQQDRGGSGTDLEIGELWRAAGPRAPRYLHAALTAAPMGCLYILFLYESSIYGGVHLLHKMLDLLLYSPTSGTIIVIGVIIPCALTLTRSPHIQRADFQRLRHLGGAEIRTLAFWQAVGLAAGFAYCLWERLVLEPTSFAVWLVVWLAVGLVAGLVYGLAEIVRESPQAITRPSSLLHEDLSFSFAFWFTVGLAGGLAYGFTVGFKITPSGKPVGLAVGLAAGLAEGLAYGLVHALAISLVRPLSGIPYLLLGSLVGGLAIGLAIGLVGGPAGAFEWGLVFGLMYALAYELASSAWPRFGIAGAILARRGVTPGLLLDFFDWAYSAGLLRLSGTSLQFRHIELQRWIERQL
jgi:hypothetical protein